jgi:O-acetyl-ADP-ribose deacetylase (regulator of RNase III)
MEIIELEGNLLDSKDNIIAHQCNCRGGFGSGVAKAIRDKWPLVYQKFMEAFHLSKRSSDLLGKIQVVKLTKDQRVVNLYAQEDYGYDGQRYTSYDALDKCLKKLSSYCVENKLNTVSIPYKMSSDRGGADWDVVLALIKSAFKDTDVKISTWKLTKDQTEI